MKNTTRKDIAFTPGLMPANSLRPGDATMCHNLRPGISDSTLIPVGEPRTIADCNATPFFLFRDSNGAKTLFLKSGNILLYTNPDAENVTINEPVTLPSEPYCGIASGETAIIMTREGAYRLVHDEDTGNWSVAGILPSLPPISIVAMQTATFSSTIPSRTLSGGYTRCQGNLTLSDTKAITADLLTAYSDICAKATTAGYYIQPIMAGYRIYDRDGRMLYESAPVLVTSPDGFQCTEAISTNVNAVSGVFTEAEAHTLTATGFKPGIVAPETAEYPWNEIAASVEIYVTPQLHPVDFNAMTSHRLESNSATQGTLRMYLPGTANAMVPATARREEMIVATAERMEAVSSPIKVYVKPFSGGISATAGEITATGCITMLPPSEEIKSLKRTLSTKSDGTDDILLRETNIPHSFSARTANVSGDVIVWGDITPRLSDGYPAGIFAASTTSGKWRACIKTVLGSRGETVVWHGEGETNAPLTFTPFLSYPHPEASEMTIKVNYEDGRTMSRSFPLTPSPGKRYAYYLDTKCMPISLETALDAYVIPAESRNTERHPGTVISSRTTEPLTANASLKVSQGGITAITQAVRSSSSWDFARTHLYAFTSTGVYALSVNCSRSVIAANIIDPRGVAGSQQVTVTTDGVYALTDGRLTSIKGSKPETADTQHRFKATGWCSATNELWCITEDNRLLVRPANTSGYYSRGLPVPTAMLSADGELYAISEGHLLDASTEKAPDTQNVGWSTRLEMDGSAGALQRYKGAIPRITGLTWKMPAREADVKLSLRGDGGAGEKNSYPMISLGIKGSINNPIATRVIAPPREYVTISVSGNMSSDAMIGGGTLRLG